MTFPEFYLHVGWGKTATKTLQIHVFPGLRGITYLGKRPRFVSDDVSKLMGEVTSTAVFDADKSRHRLADIVDVEGQDGWPIVLSMESLIFPNPQTMASRETIAIRLREVFGKSRIIITIREQFDWLRSYYVFSRLKPEKGTRQWWSLERWLDYHLKHPETTVVDALNFDATVAQYESLFGKGNIGLFVYEQFRRNPGEFADSIARFLGVAANDGWLANGVPRENRSLYTQRWLVYREFARILGSLNPIERLISRPTLRHFFAGGKTVPLKISNVYRERLAEKYRMGNLALANRYGVDLGDYGYVI